MQETKVVARWLHELGNRLPGATDQDHIARLVGTSTDETFLLFLHAIGKELENGVPYGCAVARIMSFQISDELRKHVTSVPTSLEVDVVLLDAAFSMVAESCDHERLQSMFERADCAYSQHRDQRRGPGPYDLDLRLTFTERGSNNETVTKKVNVSFGFSDGGRLESVRAYSPDSPEMFGRE